MHGRKPLPEWNSKKRLVLYFVERKYGVSFILPFPGAYVFSETLKNLPWLSFGKIRVGYAEVGSDGDVGPYADQLFYSCKCHT